MSSQTTHKGFTIIEVVLVLAIAGLIFLMVFIALPAMQRGQRDQARKSDANLVATAVTSYTSANREKWPTSERLREYVDGVSKNTNPAEIKMDTSKPASVAPADSAIIVVTGMKCGESEKERQNLMPGTPRQFVVVTKLEAGGGQFYCQ